MTNKLTIAIPTYNRKDLLLKNVKNILTHSEECRVLIIDNATPKFEKIDLKQELGSLYTENIGRIKFIKNMINIGGNANVLRCIEYCETEYVWILGDDDFLLINFEAIVKPLLRQKHDWILFHQKDQFQPSRDKSRVVNSLESFLESLKSINELVFCSVNIYKTNSLKLGLEYSYENLNVMAPHLVAMIAGIEQNKSDKKSFLISKEEILESVSNNKDTSTSWPLYKAFLGIYKLPRLEFGKTIVTLLKRLVRNSRKRWLNDKSLIYSMARLSEEKGVVAAYKITNNFISDTANIESVKSVYTSSLYIVSILFGKRIIKLNNHLRYLRMYKNAR